MKSESIAFIPAAVPMLPHRDGFFSPAPQSNLGLQKLTNRAIMQVVSIDCELGETLLQRGFPPNGSQFYAYRAPPSVAEGGGALWFGIPHKSSTRTKKSLVLGFVLPFRTSIVYYIHYFRESQRLFTKIVNIGVLYNIYLKIFVICNKGGLWICI